MSALTSKALVTRLMAFMMVSYTIGFVVTALFWLPRHGAWGALLLLSYWVLALPLLGICDFVILLFRESFLRRRVTWCALAPPSVLLTWAAAAFVFVYHQRGFTFASFLKFTGVREPAFMVTSISLVAALVFFAMLQSLPAEAAQVFRKKCSSPPTVLR